MEPSRESALLARIIARNLELSEDVRRLTRENARLQKRLLAHARSRPAAARPTQARRTKPKVTTKKKR